MRTLKHFLRACSLTAAGLIVGLGQAWPAEYFLKAEQFAMTLPDGATTVLMWGYSRCTDGSYGDCQAPTVPGPQLTVAAGDAQLIVHLRNNLPVTPAAVPNMTSIVIPGQKEDVMVPVLVLESANPHDSLAAPRSRMRSFTHETIQGGTGDYTWSNLKPGTYLYHSGTQAQVQVQMGLYGAVTKDATSSLPSEAYAGKVYDRQVTVLLHEIDPALHMEVATGGYGLPNHPTSTINYVPKYTLMTVNGVPYGPASTPVSVGAVGERILLRVLNAGLETHVPTLLGSHLKVAAIDGTALLHEKEQYEMLLAAGQTMDALWVPATAGDYAFYDRRNRNGMLAKLNVGASTGPVATPDSYSTPEDTQLTVAVPGLLVNDGNIVAGTSVVSLVSGPTSGTLTLGNDGSFTYMPVLNFNGQATFAYKVTNGTQESNVATVTIAVTPVNDAPVVANDAATTKIGKATLIPVLANDSDVEGSPLTIVSVTQGSLGTVTINPTTPNTVTYTASAVGVDTFTYTVSDGTATSVGTVNVTVVANNPPVANNDAVTVAEDSSVTVNVLGNDSDPDNDPLTVTAVGTPTANGGTVTTNGTSVTYRPAANWNGIDSFTYTISDGAATASATVTVTVTPVADAPIAIAETYRVNKATSFTVQVPGVLTNDSDPDNLVAPFNAGLTAIRDQNVKSGSVVLNSNGSFTYTMAASYVGTQAFRYHTRDASGQNSAIVNVTLIKDLTVTGITVAANGDWVIRGKSTMPLSTVQVFANPTPGVNLIGTTIVGSNGTWTVRVPGATLTSGSQISVRSSTGAELIEVPVP